MKIKKILKDNIDKKRTLLGIGPMSKNCIDASIELSDKYLLPLMLIASRRQIDFKEIGGGYVENWSTHSLVNMFKKNQKNKSYYVEITEVLGKII